jgi:phospholipase C
MNYNSRRSVYLGIVLSALLGLGACGGGTGTTTVNNPPPTSAPTLVFSANTNTITAGQSVKLTWQTTNATSVTITAAAGSASRTLAINGLSGTVTDSPTQTTTYTAVATGAGGSTKPQTAAVQVVQPVPPQITQFTATPAAVNAGQATTITWATSNATAVTITPPIPQIEGTTSLPTSGTAVVPVNSTTTFTISASGPGGAATQNLTVTVPFALSLTASPSTITAGQQVTLTWQVTLGTATTLSIDNGVCTACTLPKGTATVSPTTTTTYTATATAADGSVIKQSTTVTVGSPSTGVIKHIFFLLQENRSFDMYFGQLAGYQPTRLAQFGILNPPTINTFDPNVMLTNNNAPPPNKVKPFHEKTVCTENLSPAWDESHHDVALNGGDGAWPKWPATKTYAATDFFMNGFLDTAGDVTQTYDPKGTRAMGYYDETDLPYYYDLATFFATSDSWHSPVMANTVPNRMYLMAGSSFGHEYPDFDSKHPLYAAKTIFHAMNDANVSWQYFYKDGIFLANFADFNDPKIGPKTYPVSSLLSVLTCGTSCDPDKTLPQVIFIDSASGGSGLDEHPDNNIQTGAAYVQSIIEALMKSDAWQDSAFILSYDEAGGLYEHVPPFAVPPPDTNGPGQCPDLNNGSTGYCTTGNLGGAFDLTGLRVPVIVISPYAKPHYVSHIPRDYTAILAFIEETFNVTPLTARDTYWKDPTRDMNEFFDFTTTPPVLLNPPTPGQTWPQFLNPQTTTGVCDQTKEAGPTF